MFMGNRESNQEPTERWWPVIQVNGQRRYGPPADWIGPPPPKGTEVFVSRLPPHWYEDYLCPIFSTVGKIFELRILMDFSGLNRGYCFVRYATVEMANRAIRELNRTRIALNSIIVVEKSLDNCKLFLSLVPSYFTNEYVVAYLSRCHIEGLVGAQVIKSKKNNHHFCFLEFSDHRMAAMARRRLTLSRIPGWNWDFNVDWAVPGGRRVRHEEKTHRLYIDNLTHYGTEEEIEYLLKVTTVNSRAVQSIRKEGTVGTVELSSRSVGNYMIGKLNGTTYVTGFLKVSWKKPTRPRSDEMHRRPELPPFAGQLLPPSRQLLFDHSCPNDHFHINSKLNLFPTAFSPPSTCKSTNSSSDIMQFFPNDFKFVETALFETDLQAVSPQLEISNFSSSTNALTPPTSDEETENSVNYSGGSVYSNLTDDISVRLNYMGEHESDMGVNLIEGRHYKILPETRGAPNSAVNPAASIGQPSAFLDRPVPTCDVAYQHPENFIAVQHKAPGFFERI